MATQISHLAHAFPRWQTDHTRERDALWLTVGLLVSLVGIVPAFAFFVRWLSLPIPLPSLIGVGIVLAIYAIIAVLIRRVTVGVLCALVVLSTFAANVPLPGFSLSYAGWLGPALWLFYPALGAGVIIATVQRWDRDMMVTRTHYALGALVIWSFLAAIFGAGPRPDAAFWFGTHLLVTAAVFVLVAAAVQTGRIELRTVVAVLVLSVLAHTAFASIEFLHQGPFGLTRLGESGRYSAVSIAIGPLTFAGGSYLAGFMGSSVALYSLTALLSPILLLYALFASGRAWVRWAAATGAVWLFAVVRLTFRDAGRGAALLVLALVVGVIVATLLRPHHQRAIAVSIEAIYRRLVGTVIAIVAGVLALLYPGSVSGDAVDISVQQPPLPSETDAGGDGGTSAGVGGGGGTSAGTSNTETSTPAPTLADRLDGLHIPLFDISTLGGRTQQYLTTIDVTLAHPLFGLGGSNFPYIAARYGLSGATAPGVDAGQAVHNAYLAVLVGTGVPGFVFFVAVLVGIVWSCLLLVRHRTVEHWLALGLLCGLFGYYAALFWDLQWATVAGWMPFWILAGGIVGAAQHQRTPSLS